MLKEAYVTMKVYWTTETPNSPTGLKDELEKVFANSAIFKADFRSIGGIRTAHA